MGLAKSILGGFVIGAGVVAVVAATLALHTLAIWLLWGWFVVPLGVQAMSFLHAFGFGLFAGLFIQYRMKKGEAGDHPFWPHLAKPTLAIILGYFIQLGM